MSHGSGRAPWFLGLVLGCFFLSTAAQAQVSGLQLTLSPYAGTTFWDSDVDLESRFLAGGRIGLLFGRYVGIEGTYGRHWTEVSTSPSTSVTANHVGTDLFIDLLPRSAIIPYLTGGWAQIGFDSDPGETQTFNGWEFGGGVRIRLVERLRLRLDVRDVFLKRDAPFPENTTHNIFATAGVQLALGGRVVDEDGDGIGDRKDECPGTPTGAIVDLRGCPSDSDQDGVYDGIDKCASTPKQARVDTRGCPGDSDGDGIFDGLDLCAATPKRALVDEQGCPLDTDGDGVFDGLDECRNTPSGARVNEIGCPLDSDQDGVYDGLDLCADTPADMRVDKSGCPIVVSEKETQLLDTGMIRLDNIQFETALWNIDPGSHSILDEVGRILVQWPQLQIEIGGHTDSRGSESYNLELSKKRAQAVLDYLVNRFPKMRSSQYSVRGYGEGTPIESNASELGRSKNRRVEFKVLNREVLRKEIERRKMLPKHGG